ncbi:unnamed protein product [Protopolystoma xenopodis]|uniref:Uncharacterized protein n=1 Tax=Protopolystoma xenopodis TaxID=117903 RepID=A0A448WGB9_9PLAT|nr:unnamed protein product [Protopolystoma xenopodis]
MKEGGLTPREQAVCRLIVNKVRVGVVRQSSHVSRTRLDHGDQGLIVLDHPVKEEAHPLPQLDLLIATNVAIASAADPLLQPKEENQVHDGPDTSEGRHHFTGLPDAQLVLPEGNFGETISQKT